MKLRLILSEIAMSKNESQHTALQKLHQELKKLAAAKKLPLSQSADDIVPGEGKSDAKVMLIGEAPGFYESVQHRPFVGRSGQLLRKTLEEVGLPVAEVYISNIVKIRPPDNRDPLPLEIAAFKPFLDQEIETINPTLIVTLGRFSMGKFLPDVKVSQVHGRLHKVKWKDKNLFVLPMYHPAAALRATKVKEMFAQDFQKIKKIVQWIDGQQDLLHLETQVKEALL